MARISWNNGLSFIAFEVEDGWFKGAKGKGFSEDFIGYRVLINRLRRPQHYIISLVKSIQSEDDPEADIPGTPPSFTQHPQSVTIQAGDPLNLQVQAAGTQPLAFQWRKDGQAIPGAISDVYTVTSSSLADGGTYNAVVANSEGSVTSNPAVLPFSGASSFDGTDLSIGGLAEIDVSSSSNGTGEAPELAIEIFSGVWITGTAGADYIIEYSDTLDPGSWIELDMITLETSPQLWIDIDSTEFPSRFYRARLP